MRGTERLVLGRLRIYELWLALVSLTLMSFGWGCAAKAYDASAESAPAPQQTPQVAGAPAPEEPSPAGRGEIQRVPGTQGEALRAMDGASGTPGADAKADNTLAA